MYILAFKKIFSKRICEILQQNNHLNLKQREYQIKQCLKKLIYSTEMNFICDQWAWTNIYENIFFPEPLKASPNPLDLFFMLITAFHWFLVVTSSSMVLWYCVLGRTTTPLVFNVTQFVSHTLILRNLLARHGHHEIRYWNFHA